MNLEQIKAIAAEVYDTYVNREPVYIDHKLSRKEFMAEQRVIGLEIIEKVISKHLKPVPTAKINFFGPNSATRALHEEQYQISKKHLDIQCVKDLHKQKRSG